MPPPTLSSVNGYVPNGVVIAAVTVTTVDPVGTTGLFLMTAEAPAGNPERDILTGRVNPFEAVRLIVYAMLLFWITV